MHDEYVRARQLDAGIQGSDPVVIPFLDAAHKNPGDCFGGQLQWSCYAGKVVSDHIGAQHRRDMENRPTLGLAHFVVGHRAIGGAEVDSLLG